MYGGSLVFASRSTKKRQQPFPRELQFHSRLAPNRETSAVDSPGRGGAAF